MSRFVAVLGLLLGGVMLLGVPAPLPAQQFRNLQPLKAPPIPAVQNNPNFAPVQQGQQGIGFNAPGAINPANVQNGALGGTANSIINGLNNGTLNGLNNNPYNNAFPGAFNPYANNAALSPYNYNTMMYGTPYGPMPINPFYPAYNPYAFPNTGAIIGASGGMPGTPSPAQLYNFNLNYQYLSNPNINPLSNPAFSGPFPPGVFNSTAALNLMGFGSILQNMPLNPTPAAPANNQIFP